MSSLPSISALQSRKPAQQRLLRFATDKSHPLCAAVVALSFYRAREGLLGARERRTQADPIPGGTDKMVAARDQATIDVTQTATPFSFRRCSGGPMRWRSRAKAPIRFTGSWQSGRF